MQRRLCWSGIAFVLMIGVIAPPEPGLAGEEHGAHHDMAEKGKPVAGTETLGGLWRAVKAREGELNNIIAAKELGKVHEVAFAIRDLVAVLPEKSGQLSAEQQVTLKGNVKYVATLAERLDAAGDAKSQSAVESNFKQLRSVLGAIEGLYPPDALKQAAMVRRAPLMVSAESSVSMRRRVRHG
jgi:hypothetical protein